MHGRLEFLVSVEQPTGLESNLAHESWMCLDYIIHFLAHETLSPVKTRLLKLLVIDFVRTDWRYF